MNNIVNIEIDTLEGGANISIDRAQTSVGFLAFGIISGSLKAFYNHYACCLIARYLSVAAGFRKGGVEMDSDQYRYAVVANKILAGVRQLFEGFEDYEFEVARCCRYIYDELLLPSSGNVYYYSNMDDLQVDAEHE